MKQLLMGACLLLWAGAVVTGQVAAWDFYGQSFPVSCAAATFDTCLVSASGANLITRGPGAPASGGVHSFRTTGFQNNGISVSNSDYFQVTLTAKPGYKLSLSTLDAKFNGTTSFFASPGVTSQFAYSLDGINFTLIGNPVQSTSLTMAQVNLSSIPALQNVYSSVTVTIRYFASGQTSTGGWGFYSASAGTSGFAIGGSVVAATIAPPTIQASGIAAVNAGLTQLSVAWTPGNGDKRIVKMNVTNSFVPPANGTDPPANPVYAGSGEQVVYNGTGSSVPAITGLQPGTSYWFRVYEYNGAGTLTQYNTATAVNNPAQAATSGLLMPPAVIPLEATAVANSSAMLGGRITSDGGSPVTERGTLWSLQIPVTMADNPLPEGGADTGVFVQQRTGLPPASLIHHAAYAINIIGSSVSQEESFYTLAVEPMSHVAGFSVINATTTTLDLAWTPTINGTGGYLILQKTGGAPSTATPSDAIQYSVGSMLGDAIVAARVEGLQNTLSVIAGLSPGTSYTFTVFPYLWDGTHAQTTNYRIDPVVPSVTGTTVIPPIVTYYWTGSGGNNWNTAGSWNPQRLVPALNDILIFSQGGITTITNLPTQTIGQLTVTANTTVTLQGNGTLTVAGDEGDDLLVASGSQLNLSGSGAVILSLASTAHGKVAGSMTLSGGGHRLLCVDPEGLIFLPGSTFTAGSGFSGNPFGTVNLGSVIFHSGSAYIAMAGGNPFGAPAPASVVVFQPGSLYRIDAYHVPSFGGRTYGNFEVNYAGMITVTGTAAVSIDHFIASRGSFYFNVTGNPGHSIKGDLYVSGLATLFFSPTSAGTIHFNGASPQTIYGSGSIISGSNSKIMIDNTAGFSCAMDTEFNDVTIGDGVMVDVLPAVTLTVEGDLVK